MSPRRPPTTRRSPLHQEPDSVTWAREKAGYTKADVAREMKVSATFVGDIEAGRRSARPELLARMAGLFNCPVAVLERKRIPVHESCVCAEPGREAS